MSIAASVVMGIVMYLFDHDITVVCPGRSGASSCPVPPSEYTLSMDKTSAKGNPALYICPGHDDNVTNASNSSVTTENAEIDSGDL